MPADDYSDGMDGAGQTWKDRVDTDESESNYEGGATSEAADNYEQNAGEAGDSYAEGVASYFGVDETDVQVDDDYESGVRDAGSSWQQGVSASGEKWRDGVSRADASEYEQSAKDAAQDWFNNAKEGIQDN